MSKVLAFFFLSNLMSFRLTCCDLLRVDELTIYLLNFINAFLTYDKVLKDK